jgi:hypothetical protein
VLGGAVIQKKAVSVEEEPKVEFSLATTFKRAATPRVRYIREIIEYGTYIPTLSRLADEGCFD